MRPLRGGDPRAKKIVLGRSKSGGAHRVTVAGVSLSHPDRVFWPDAGVSKLELARYYESIADHLLPHLRGRPLTLVRCPETIAECAYLRHVRAWGPSTLRRVSIREKTKTGEYLVADDLPGVIGLVQMDIVEIHTWNSTVDALEQPNRMVMDVDPPEGAAWSEVAGCARELRQRLDALGLTSFVKTTGGNGLHVVVPLEPSADWDTCLAFARALAGSVARRRPDAYTTLLPKRLRRGRIFLDYLRNNRTNTSVAAFSTRARPGAPVSVPIGWQELARPPRLTVRTLPARLERQKHDPWAGYDRARQRITPEMIVALARV